MPIGTNHWGLLPAGVLGEGGLERQAAGEEGPEVEQVLLHACKC